MKSQYRKYKNRWAGKHPGEFHYEHVKRSYYRRIRTFPELRRLAGDKADYEHASYIDVGRNRGRNSKMLDAWNDFPKKRTSGNARSWKDFTKHKKQWMVSDDPKPIHSPKTRFWGMMVLMGLEHDC